MSERDWQKDMERCEKAPGGLWSRVKALGWDYWTVGVIENHQARPFRGEEAERAWAFIEATREGWPAALEERARLEERVQELEEENARLQKKIAGLEEYVRELQEEVQDFIDRG